MALLKVILLLLLFVNYVSAYKLTILHTNDVHARLEETNKYSAACSEKDKTEHKCYGGVARRVTKIKEIRENETNVLLLDAGDQFQGTLWFSYYKGNATSQFMNLLNYDAMTLGNHEFDHGVEGLVPFLKSVNFPVLACNMDSTEEPLMTGLYQCSVTLQVGGQKIGIVGYIIQGVTLMTNPKGLGKLKFTDEIKTVQEEVNKLLNKGVDKIIALGHAGIEIDRKIAKQVSGVDVVIGGHSHSFLYSGDAPSNEAEEAPYPTVIENIDGEKTLLVQAYAYGKYLGQLNVDFDDDGKVQGWTGDPILLDGSVEQDNETLEEVVKQKAPLTSFQNIQVGETYSFLDGERESCRLKECVMGNLVTDAMVYNSVIPPAANSTSWSDVGLAVYNGGGIRISFTQGKITKADLITMLPFRNTIELLELKGSKIRQALGQSASRHNIEDPSGGFLQLSGFQVTYALFKPKGLRIVQVLVRCAGCPYPQYEPLDDNKLYKVLVNNFMYNGGDGYSMFHDDDVKVSFLGVLVTDALENYLKTKSPIIHGSERRIIIVDSATDPPPKQCPANSSSTCKPGSVWLLSLVFFVFLALRH